MTSDTASTLRTIGGFALGFLIGGIASREWQRIQDESAAKQMIAQQQAEPLHPDDFRAPDPHRYPGAHGPEMPEIETEPVECPLCETGFDSEIHVDSTQCPNCGNTFPK